MDKYLKQFIVFFRKNKALFLMAGFFISFFVFYSVGPVFSADKNTAVETRGVIKKPVNFHFINSVSAQATQDRRDLINKDSSAPASKKTNAMQDFVLGAVSFVFMPIIQILGFLLTMLMGIVIKIAGYNGFATSAAVINGWVVVRDICNMFFIVILLVIAFSVILRIEGYDIKKTIPKLLIMAVLINFSKTICGLIIDASQLIMGTFVNTFQGGVNLVEILQVGEYLKFAENTSSVANIGNGIVSYIAATIFLLISLVVVVALLGVLVMRIVMLWIYVVLSPLAFFLASFPQGKSYSQKWWKEFTENVIVGPVLAFFLWLAFATLGNQASPLGSSVTFSSETTPSGLTAILTGDAMVKYIVGIAMLLGGLMISQSLAGATGKFAGKMLGKIQTGTDFVKKRAKAGAMAVGVGALNTAKTAGGTLDRFVGRGVGALTDKAGKKFGDNSVGRAFSGAGKAFAEGGLVASTMAGVKNMPGNFMSGVKEKLEKNRALNVAASGGRLNENGLFAHEGFDYKWNDNYIDKNGKKKGVYQKWNKETESFENDDEGKAKDGSILEKDGKVMKKVNPFMASVYSSMNANNSASRVAADGAGGKVVDGELEKIKSADLSNEEAMRQLRIFSTSAPKKMALALFLASKKAFKNKEEKDVARAAVASNSVVTGKFDEEVMKNQAHLSYDIDSKDDNLRANEKIRLAKDLSKGKVDFNNMSKDMVKNKSFQAELRKWAKDPITGSEEKYSRIMEKNAENGGGENSKNIRDLVKSQVGKNTDGSDVGIEKDSSARLIARITGDLESAFAGADGKFTDEGLKAMGKYLATSSTKELSKVDPDKLKEITKNNPEAAKTIALNMKLSAIKTLARNPETTELAEIMKDLAIEVGYNSHSTGKYKLTADEDIKISSLVGKIEHDPELKV